MELQAYRPRKPVRSGSNRKTTRAIGLTLCASTHPDCSCSSMSGGDLPSGASIEQSCRVFYRGNRIVFARPPHYGVIFTNHEARDQFLLERGYLVTYSRNCVTFTSSRAFRKHTGKVAVDEERWNRWNKRDPRV